MKRRKKHWTQTPEGRIRAKAILDRGKAAKANKENGNHVRKEDPTDKQFIYALGQVQGWISAYSAGIGCSPNSLAARVGIAIQEQGPGPRS